MTSLTFLLLWCALQVTLLSLLTAVVYLLVGRRGPSVGSAVLLAGSAGVLLTTALAVSPWPRWYTFDWSAQPVKAAPDRLAEAAPSDTAVAAAQEVAPAGKPTARQVEFADASLWTALADTLRTGFRPAPLDAPRATPWPAILVGVGTLVCIVRLAIGMGIVHAYRQRSRPVVDEELHNALAQLQNEMRCRLPVELRESRLISSPAVVGWRKPLLLLPADWRTWSDGERRAVLAHELAHVCRGDYAAWLLAQLGLALHFYHPLLHWLIRRLRLEQELAADEWGARVAGGRAAYLRALAQLALRRDSLPVVWAAQPLFPRRDTFVRRIEMLRNQQHLPWQPNPWRTRAAAVSAVLFAALLVAGLRGPTAALAQARSGLARTPSQASDERFSLRFVPADAVLVAAFRPADLLAKPGIAELTDKWDWTAHLKEQGGIALSDLEEITLVFPSFPLPRNTEAMGVIRSPKAAALVEYVQKTGLELETRDFNGAKYRFSSRMHPPAAFVANDRTLILGDEPQIRLAIAASLNDSEGSSGPPWADLWNAQPAGQGRLAFNVKAWAAATGLDHGEVPQGFNASREMVAALAAFRPIVRNVSAFVGSARIDGKLKLSAEATTASNEAADEVVETAVALRAVAKNLARESRQSMERQPETPAGVPQLLAMLEDLLVHSEIKAADKVVRITADSSHDSTKVAATFLPAMAQARESARRSEAVNNLKQIGLAMYIYSDLADSRFPPAVLYGPDGKTPYSWRVALLPHLDQKALYDEYKFNEPWDSEANRRVLDKMPAVFRNPNADPQSTNTSYFVLTGAETLFAGKEGQKYTEIADGTSNTLLIVEAKREIPWTKPEDIPYGGKLSAADLGGFFNGGFNVTFADGSVRFLSQEIDEKTLQALITARGGEVMADPGRGPIELK